MRLTKLSEKPESSREEDEIQKQKYTNLALDGDIKLGLKKRVSFSPRVHQKKYHSRKDMRREEVEASWFSMEEFRAIQASCAKDVIRGAKGRYWYTDNGKTPYIRGLETYLPTGHIVKSRNRSTATRAVLDAQDHFWHERSCNYEEQIAKAYHQASSSSALWARRSGLLDQNEADAIYDDLENDCIKRTSMTNTIESSATPSNIARAAKAA